MRKQTRRITGGLLAAGLLTTGLTTIATVYAANTGTGAAGASADTEYSLEEMLVYAIEDEYLAQAEYDVIMDTYGIQKPFSNIIKAEATHISLLDPLFEEYGVSVPAKDWESLVAVPESLDAAYAIGVEAEEKNIAMYENFLKENLPDDVREVFEALMNASEKHLVAFQRQVDGVTGGSRNGNGNGTETGIQTGKGNAGTGGNGHGNRNSSQNKCIVE
ncbi:MAG: DUF2202 domain-containing protein [Anaerostipes sp.]|nr:DUF2202 domain-containing protein [Massilibacteroides sp.]MDD3747518.1 DUF2202 domain-containing protein [Anaerostipes sp.]